MNRIISALAFSLFSLSANAIEPSALAEDAPDRHIVARGDTLWGIAGKFLKDPWRWPELWQGNRDVVKDPHWIYPGDVLVLDRATGTLRRAKTVGDASSVRVEPKVYEEKNASFIPTIPPNVIGPFLSQPLVIEADALKSAPRIVGSQEGRVMLGTGEKAFATGVTGSNRLWHVYRPGRPLKDPESGEVLGHEAIFLGTAELRQPGEPAELVIQVANQEMAKDDRLVPAERPVVLAYMPKAPSRPVAARIMSFYGGVDAGGQYTILTLNKGKRDGLEIGDVLAVHRAGRVAENRDDDGKVLRTQLPNDRTGLVFVFRTFDRVSYALVMQAERPLAVGDAASNP